MISELAAHGQNFLLVVLRLGCLLAFLPPWDSRFLPLPVKVSGVLALALALAPVAAPHLPQFPDSWSALALMGVKEMVLGLSLGLAVRVVFAGVQMAGNLMGVQMGFGMATLLDPQTQAQNTVVANFLGLSATLAFLAADGHHLLLWVTARSFAEVPLGGLIILPELSVRTLGFLGGRMFQDCLSLAIPVLAGLLVLQAALGLVARSVPQVQVMVLGFPLTVGLGLVLAYLSLEWFWPHLAGEFGGAVEVMLQNLRNWRG